MRWILFVKYLFEKLKSIKKNNKKNFRPRFSTHSTKMQISTKKKFTKVFYAFSESFSILELHHTVKNNKKLCHYNIKLNYNQHNLKRITS